MLPFIYTIIFKYPIHMLNHAWYREYLPEEIKLPNVEFHYFKKDNNLINVWEYIKNRNKLK